MKTEIKTTKLGNYYGNVEIVRIPMPEKEEDYYQIQLEDFDGSLSEWAISRRLYNLILKELVNK